VFAELFVDAVDELQGAEDVAAAPLVGLDPDGEELGGEVAGARGRQIEHAGSERAGEVPALVDEALRGVGVAVDDQRSQKRQDWDRACC
jgi:hypothetical protein